MVSPAPDNPAIDEQLRQWMANVGRPIQRHAVRARFGDAGSPALDRLLDAGSVEETWVDPPEDAPSLGDQPRCYFRVRGIAPPHGSEPASSPDERSVVPGPDRGPFITVVILLVLFGAVVAGGLFAATQAKTIFAMAPLVAAMIGLIAWRMMR